MMGMITKLQIDNRKRLERSRSTKNSDFNFFRFPVVNGTPFSVFSEIS